MLDPLNCPSTQQIFSIYWMPNTILDATSSEQDAQSPFLLWMASTEKDNEPVIIQLTIILTTAMEKHGEF